jgi:hypothetical protein
VAGAIVYWRAGERRRARDSAAVDDAVDEGRRAAHSLLEGADDDSAPFDQR